MNKILSFICCLCVCAASALAGGKNVKIKVVTPGTLTELLKGYADNEIKGLSVTGTLNANDVQSLQRFAGRNNSEKKHEGGLLEVLNLGKTTLTDMESGLNLAAVIAGSTTLRKVMLGNIFYVSAHTFSALPNLESVDFIGNVGHIDGYVFNNLPKLSRITFHQSVLSTGGAQFVKNCPVLTSVVFKGPILTTYYGQPIECPQLKGYTLKAPVLQSNFAAFFPQTTDAKALKACNWKGCMAYVETWGKLCLTGTSDFFADSPGTIVNLLFDMAKKTGNASMTKQLFQRNSKRPLRRDRRKKPNWRFLSNRRPTNARDRQCQPSPTLRQTTRCSPAPAISSILMRWLERATTSHASSVCSIGCTTSCATTAVQAGRNAATTAWTSTNSAKRKSAASTAASWRKCSAKRSWRKTFRHATSPASRGNTTQTTTATSSPLPGAAS